MGERRGGLVGVLRNAARRPLTKRGGAAPGWQGRRGAQDSGR